MAVELELSGAVAPERLLQLMRLYHCMYEGANLQPMWRWLRIQTRSQTRMCVGVG